MFNTDAVENNPSLANTAPEYGEDPTPTKVAEPAPSNASKSILANYIRKEQGIHSSPGLPAPLPEVIDAELFSMVFAAECDSTDRACTNIDINFWSEGHAFAETFTSAASVGVQRSISSTLKYFDGR